MTQEAALTACIAAEDAAIYAYGYLGPRLDESDRAAARTAIAAHQQRGYALRERLLALDGSVPDAPVAYDIPMTVDDAQSARALAALVESRLAAAYADLAAASEGTRRADAVLAAREAAVRSVGWGSAPQAFPGLPD